MMHNAEIPAMQYAELRSHREPTIEIRVWYCGSGTGRRIPVYAVRSEMVPDFPGGTIIRRFLAGKELQ